LFAIITGGFIYIFLRPAEPEFFNWFNRIGFDTWLTGIRERSLNFYNFFPKWIVFSLPGGLWAFAYSLFILNIWTGSTSIMKYFWFMSIPVLIFGFEILQFTGALRGTFCLNDIIWGAIGIIAAIAMVYMRNMKKK
jgi:hypothetical protein